MAKVYPFQALRYAADRVDLAKVTTQPYDKISREMQEKYYAMHPWNIVRIILGKPQVADNAGDNVYTRAAATMAEWRREGVLVPLARPSFVVCYQTFVIPGTNETQVRKGFIGLGQLEDYEDGIIFPHERTLTGPKKDRLQLLRHTRTQFEQIFMLYEDPSRTIDKAMDEVAAGNPDIHLTDEFGVSHTLWIVDQPELLSLLQAEMEGRRLIIADGHHRYETALAYRNEMRAKSGTHPNAPYERMPMTFFNMHSPGLTILPTHRVVSQVGGFDSAAMLEKAARHFDVAEAPSNSQEFRAALRTEGEGRIAIGACTDGGLRNVILKLRDSGSSQFDVVALHQLIIDQCLGISEEEVRKERNITYTREFEGALAAVRAGMAQVAFLLNPTRLEQMRDVAYAGEVMPQKSTDFYPKVLSGLMMYSLES